MKIFVPSNPVMHTNGVVSNETRVVVKPVVLAVFKSPVRLL